MPTMTAQHHDRIFLRLGPNGALGADRLQWIVYRAAFDDIPLDAPLRPFEWRRVAFVKSSRQILERCIHAKGIVLSAEGRLALERLPTCFDDWKAALATRDAVLGGAQNEAEEGRAA